MTNFSIFDILTYINCPWWLYRNWHLKSLFKWNICRKSSITVYVLCVWKNLFTETYLWGGRGGFAWFVFRQKWIERQYDTIHNVCHYIGQEFKINKKPKVQSNPHAKQQWWRECKLFTGRVCVCFSFYSFINLMSYYFSCVLPLISYYSVCVNNNNYNTQSHAHAHNYHANS